MTSQRKLAGTVVPFVLSVGMSLASLEALAGTPTPTGPPSAPGPRFTLGDVYLQLTTGANPGPHTGGFMEPSSGPPVSTAATVDQILSAAPAVDATNGATAGQVLAGKTFWGLQSGGGWGVQTGTLATKALSASSAAVAAGYYAATTLDAVDTDLKTANIRAGVNIFGIDGATNVVDTTTGTAAATDILSGKKAWVAGTEVTGSILTKALSASSAAVAAGYYAATTLDAVDTDLKTANIRAGVNIFGIDGATNVVDTTTGTAAATDILSGKKAWVAGTEVTGSILTKTLSASSTAVAAGYYAATTLDAVDTDLKTANIRAGVNIFGIDGATNVVDTTTGTAAATDILSGKKAWVAGTEVTGSILTKALSASSAAVAAGYYAATTLDAVDTDLKTANIRAGVNIFGIDGATNVVDTTTGTAAAAGDVLSGKTAYANGALVTGTVATKTLSASSTAVAAGYYAGTTLDAVDTDLKTANIKAGVNIFGIDGATNVVDTTTVTAAAPGDVLSGKTAYANGALVTGTVATKTLSATSTAVAAGYYAGTTLDAVDTDLAAGNIKSGVTIFGVTGTLASVQTLAQPGKTGQTTSYAAGDDGAVQKGIAWPSPRFTDNLDGTVTDNLTKLVWLKNAACTAFYSGDATGTNNRSWASALTAAASLASTVPGTYCGLTDGSAAGAWRLPNLSELESLRDLQYYNPALSNATGTGPCVLVGPPVDCAFTGVQTVNPYWTSSSSAVNASLAWLVYLDDGHTLANVKARTDGYVWPVRGGQ